MSLDIYLDENHRTEECRCSECGDEHAAQRADTVCEFNITHNLAPMFRELGVYEVLWAGDGLVAGELVTGLEAALQLMKLQPQRFMKFSASNGWGTYEQAVPWLQSVIVGFKANPKAVLRCSR